MLLEGSTKKVKIEDLYKRFKNPSYWGRSSNIVRVFDETSGKFTAAKIKEVFDTGVKPVFKLELDNGKSITATAEHKFLTRNGFAELGTITPGDFVGCNGDVCYQNYDWMLAAKREAIETGGGVAYMADKAGVSYHTIRKWLARLDLSFTKKEVAQYTEVWNKNLPEEMQPMYGKFHTETTRDLMRSSSRKGEDSPLYRDGKGKSWRKAVAQWSVGFKTELFHKQEGLCAITKEPLAFSECDVDHIKPVFSHPELAFDSSNLQLVSRSAHKHKSMSEIRESRYVPSYSRVKSITPCGEVQTYDMEICHESHNYVANGIVTHNSQRYADVTGDMFCHRELRMQDDKNRQNSLILDADHEWHAEWAEDQRKLIELEIQLAAKWRSRNAAKECVRVFYSEGLTMSSMYVNFNVRSLVHWIGVRRGNGTQKEHTALALKALDVCKPLFPESWDALTGVSYDD
jgi:thymidylate synthase (FAD)